ncbi:glycosyltransferase family 4 protein [Streptomyces sp. 130]|uniref:glycosyltransferase family 4 protein n=1 Tax=Streptomyces sp. 130 TaxID=2591006 RepID=UPI00163D650A|nr:glycosyltransferase family 4 protein [Streptomyces sp. 130]
MLHVCSVFKSSRSVASAAGTGYSSMGGVQIHVGALVRHLDRRGISQTVITSYKPGEPRDQHQGDHIRVRRFGVPVRRWRQLWALPAARAALDATTRVDVVHAHPSADLAALPIALWAAHRHRAPLVVTLHSSALHTMRAVNARLAALKVLGHPWEAIALRRAAAVVALTARTRDRVITSGADPARVHVLPQPYDQETFTGPFDDPSPEVPHPRIVFVGRFSAEKGVTVLVDAFSRLRSPAQLLLIGDGRERQRIQAGIRRLGIGGNVTVCGFVPHRTAAAAMAHARIVVLPSLFEEAGTVVVEAMALGVPLVASDIGGIRQTAADGKAALLVPPGDPVALAAALDEVLSRPELASRLGAAGTYESAGRGWGETGERMLGIYRDVLTAPPTP